MISLFYDNDKKVNLIYYVEFPQELEDEPHLQVENLEEPEEKPGKVAVLKADSEKYWYEYEDKELAEEEKRDQRLTDLEATLAMFLGGEF